MHLLLQVVHRETAKDSKESVEALQQWSEIGPMVCNSLQTFLNPFGIFTGTWGLENENEKVLTWLLDI